MLKLVIIIVLKSKHCRRSVSLRKIAHFIYLLFLITGTPNMMRIFQLTITILAVLLAATGNVQADIIAVGGNQQTSDPARLAFVPHIGATGLELDVIGGGSDGLTVIFNESHSTIAATSYNSNMDYLFFNETIFQPVNSALELSLQSTWVYGFKTPTTVAVGEEFTFGWRYLSSSQDYYFGWSQLKIGSLSQVQSFANNTPGGTVALNQTASVNVPEPSTLAIFALGLMGLASRRFKK
jgi:hypothetical protein